MTEKIGIILTRASWCPHCINFEPIYLLAQNECKKHNYLKNFEISFEDYDLANNDVKNTFLLNHNELNNKIQGYPSVFINLKNKTSKTNKYFPIDHTVINDKIDKSKQQLDAAQNFLENITNSLKSLNTENKVLYMQKGGDDNIMKKKYLKYKLKYLQLKNT